MRSFSALRAYCSHPENIKKPNARRDAAAELGTLFHERAERWALSLDGAMDYAGVAEPVAGWLRLLVKSWKPPEGLECELPVGLANQAWPEYVPVFEPSPHVYVPMTLRERWDAADEAGKVALLKVAAEILLTAGRADWVWPGVALHVCDVKSGKFYLGPPEHVRQVLAQGFAATERGKARSFRPGIYYARLGMFDWGPVLERGTPEWERAWDMVVTAAKLPSRPLPGPYCLDCWDSKSCASAPEGLP